MNELKEPLLQGHDRKEYTLRIYRRDVLHEIKINTGIPKAEAMLHICRHLGYPGRLQDSLVFRSLEQKGECAWGGLENLLLPWTAKYVWHVVYTPSIGDLIRMGLDRIRGKPNPFRLQEENDYFNKYTRHTYI